MIGSTLAASTVLRTGGDALIVIGCFGLVACCFYLGLDRYFRNQVKAAVRYWLYSCAAAAVAGYILYTGSQTQNGDGTRSAGHGSPAMVGGLVIGTVAVIVASAWVFYRIKKAREKRREKSCSEPTD